ncbi:hypothetical protein RF11_10871 [Thelohanellus kitauei]|uniref:Uncharacterized protein n=1 Tax=Thelohanellus kitauei TaxID=669202 RepID=A0A0C2JN69_THEKT|nr:hypothetical protein RF11_10871 [Thelohanellus kitauei]
MQKYMALILNHYLMDCKSSIFLLMLVWYMIICKNVDVPFYKHALCDEPKWPHRLNRHIVTLPLASRLANARLTDKTLTLNVLLLSRTLMLQSIRLIRGHLEQNYSLLFIATVYFTSVTFNSAQLSV